MPTAFGAVRDPLDITSDDGRKATLGISLLDDMDEPQRVLAAELGIDKYLDRLLGVVEDVDAERAKIASDARLTPTAKRDDMLAASEAGLVRIAKMTKPVSEDLATRIAGRVTDIGLGAGEEHRSPIKGVVILRELFDGRTDVGGPMTHVRVAAIAHTQRELQSLEAIELSGVISNAFYMNDAQTVAAIETLAPWQRDRLMQRAAIDEVTLARMRRAYLESRDPKTFAGVQNLLSLGGNVVRSARNAAHGLGVDYPLLNRDGRLGFEGAIKPLADAVRNFAHASDDALLGSSVGAPS